MIASRGVFFSSLFFFLLSLYPPWGRGEGGSFRRCLQKAIRGLTRWMDKIPLTHDEKKRPKTPGSVPGFWAFTVLQLAERPLRCCCAAEFKGVCSHTVSSTRRNKLCKFSRSMSHSISQRSTVMPTFPGWARKTTDNEWTYRLAMQKSASDHGGHRYFPSCSQLNQRPNEHTKKKASVLFCFAPACPASSIVRNATYWPSRRQNRRGNYSLAAIFSVGNTGKAFN